MWVDLGRDGRRAVAAGKIGELVSCHVIASPHHEIDKIIFEDNTDDDPSKPRGSLEQIEKLPVRQLRNLAREYENFPIQGREISKANKELLVKNFRIYFKSNK